MFHEACESACIAGFIDWDRARLNAGVDAVLQVAGDGAGGGYYQHMKGLDWEFAVINSPDVNAFVAPGGKVVAFTGACKQTTLLHI